MPRLIRDFVIRCDDDANWRTLPYKHRGTPTGKGYPTREDAELACRRLRARAVPCETVGG